MNLKKNVGVNETFAAKAVDLFSFFPRLIME